MNHPYSWDAICEHFGSALPQKQHSNTLSLCMAHYLQLGHLNKPEMASDVICKVCGTKWPHKQTQTWRFVACPEPKRIESYLRESADFDCSLTDCDMVCYSCYKYCKQILSSGVCTMSSEDNYYKRTDLQTGSCAQQYAWSCSWFYRVPHWIGFKEGSLVFVSVSVGWSGSATSHSIQMLPFIPTKEYWVSFQSSTFDIYW